MSLFSTESGLVACLDPVMVEAEKLGVRELTFCDKPVVSEPVEAFSLLSAPTVFVVDLKRPGVIEAALCARATKKLNGLFAENSPASPLAFGRQFLYSLRILLAPLLHSFKTTKVLTASALSTLSLEVFNRKFLKTDRTGFCVCAHAEHSSTKVRKDMV